MRWITQYGSLFCIMNSHGQVVTWKLTSGVAFDIVSDVLKALQRWLQMEGF
jgi:hypothetical protein